MNQSLARNNSEVIQITFNKQQYTPTQANVLPVFTVSTE